MNIDDLTIGEAKRLAKMFPSDTCDSAEVSLTVGAQLQIVVLDRGWVYVGHTYISGDFVVISPAKCIRRWGTTKGLTQIANNGPTSDTVLDDQAREVRAPLRALISLITVDESKWKSQF